MIDSVLRKHFLKDFKINALSVRRSRVQGPVTPAMEGDIKRVCDLKKTNGTARQRRGKKIDIKSRGWATRSITRLSTLTKSRLKVRYVGKYVTDISSSSSDSSYSINKDRV